MANLFTTSPGSSVFTTAGKHWLNADTGTLYVYLNGDWRPVVSGDPIIIDYRTPLTVLINGVDVTENVDTEGFAKEDVLTSEVDTCSFVLFDKDGVLAPIPGEEVVVYFKESAGATPVKIFGGEISECPREAQAPGADAFQWQINCVDYSKRLSKDLVVESYTNTTPGAIILDLLAKGYMVGFTGANVQAGPVISYIAFNYTPAGDCITELAQLCGYDWYVDYDRDIHFVAPGTSAAPYQITADDTTGHYKELNIALDKSQLRNRITVRGGVYLSNPYTQERVADGQQTSFQLDYKPRAPITVYVDAGAGYVAKTLGADNLDRSGYDFVVNYEEKVIRNLDHAALSAGHKLKVVYCYEVQVLTEDSDDESIALAAEIEGGDGVYEYLIADDTIETLEAAHLRATAELDMYADPLIEGSFRTDQYGYRSGQLLTMNLPSWGLSGRQVMVQRVMTEMVAGDRFEYSVYFATRLKGLTQFLVGLVDNGKKVIVRENETLHDLTRPRKDAASISDIDAFLTDGEPPYQWGPGAANPIRWNEFQWG